MKSVLILVLVVLFLCLGGCTVVWGPPDDYLLVKNNIQGVVLTNIVVNNVPFRHELEDGSSVTPIVSTGNSILVPIYYYGCNGTIRVVADVQDTRGRYLGVATTEVWVPIYSGYGYGYGRGSHCNQSLPPWIVERGSVRGVR